MSDDDKAQRCFDLTRIYGPEVMDADVFASCSPLFNSVLSGGRACIIAYGPSGSGKTHTLQASVAPGLETRFADRWH